MGQDPTQPGTAGPLLLLGGLSGWRRPQDVAPVYSSFWNECSHSLNCLPLRIDLDDSELDCSSSFVCTEDELFLSFRLPLDFLEGVLAFDSPLPLSNCESICLRVSIDSCWAQIISSCSLWAWVCCSKSLASPYGVLIMYAKASFPTEEFEGCDSAIAECDSLTSMP